MASLFQNARQAQHYAAARPTYPATLFRRIAESCGRQPGTNAVDIGCGTGQATVALAEHFQSVLGIDPSPAQLANAIPHERVTYQVGTAIEALSALPDKSVQCITAAQSAHWLFDDLPNFYSQVHRVLQPKGVLAFWVYGHLHCSSDHATLERLIRHELYEVKLGPKYWDPRRRMVENLYETMPTMDQFYNESVTTEMCKEGGDYDIVKQMTPNELLEYLQSWSGYNNYRQENPDAEDPLLELQEYLKGIAGDTIQITWPLRLFLSVKE